MSKRNRKNTKNSKSKKSPRATGNDQSETSSLGTTQLRQKVSQSTEAIFSQMLSNSKRSYMNLIS